jgi:hypothetical protein
MRRGVVLTVSGGRSWRAHCESTRINIEPTILPEKAEEPLWLRARQLEPTAGDLREEFRQIENSVRRQLL